MMTEEQDLDDLTVLKEKLRLEKGFNSHLYKDKCFRRRLAVRMRARGLQSFAAYAALLDGDPEEYDRLIDTLTINVTKFFRNIEMWTAASDLVVPELMEGSRPVRIWSAGCASGEEPYSISILLKEWAETHGGGEDLERVTILGTDIDRGSLAAAERGEYPELSMDETPERIRERWFSAGPPYRLEEEVKERVRFERSDLISDPTPGEQSLIVCRNVIIYFDRWVQEQLYRTFYDALRPGGFLILGRVETLLGPARGLFRSVNIRERIYRKPE